MTRRRRPARIGSARGIGSFDALESRLVLSYASNVAIITDVSRFYQNFVATIPGLTQAYSSAAAGSDAQKSAAADITTAINDQVNDLAERLYYNLGPRSLKVIDVGITGDLSGATPPNTTGSGSLGSLLGALLALDSADPAFLGRPGGIATLTDLVLLDAQVLAGASPMMFSTDTFGAFSSTYFNDVSFSAQRLGEAQSRDHFAEAAAQDIAAIDAVTVRDVNALAQTLQSASPAPSDALIRQVITGSTATTGVIFVGPPGSPATFGSLLSTLQSIEADPAILQDRDAVAALIAPFAYF